MNTVHPYVSICIILGDLHNFWRLTKKKDSLSSISVALCSHISSALLWRLFNSHQRLLHHSGLYLTPGSGDAPGRTDLGYEEKLNGCGDESLTTPIYLMRKETLTNRHFDDGKWMKMIDTMESEGKWQTYSIIFPFQPVTELACKTLPSAWCEASGVRVILGIYSWLCLIPGNWWIIRRVLVNVFHMEWLMKQGPKKQAQKGATQMKPTETHETAPKSNGWSSLISSLPTWHTLWQWLT